MNKAHKVINWMLEKGKYKASARDIHQALRGIFRQMKDLRPILDLLKENNYLLLSMQDSDRTGRKPSPIYQLHQDLFTQNTQNTQNAV